MSDDESCSTKIRRKLVYGWGVNDAEYSVKPYNPITGKEEKCPYYAKWFSMIERVYSINKKKETSSLNGNSVCEDWKYFSNFRKWMKSQRWDGCSLDKDILVEGNKEYSPDTCAFVPQYLNSLIMTSPAGEFPTGVIKCPSGNKTYYQARLGRSERYIGNFSTPLDAHIAWQLAKAEKIECAILDYMLHPSYRQDVANALYQRADRLRFAAENKLETRNYSAV